MSETTQEEINEVIKDIAKNHRNYSTEQFKVEFKSIIERDPTVKEKQAFQKALSNLVDGTDNTTLTSQVINGYKFGEVLGKGTFGEVYKCDKGGKSYAVKQVNESKMSAEMEEYFASGASVRLNSVFLVKYIDKFRTSAGKLFIVMELCPKGDLRARIDRLKEFGGTFTNDSLTKFLIQLVLALDTLHINKFLHRDLKPENVFVDEKDYLKLGDFGCARELDTTSGVVHTVIGTPVYESPQVLQGEDYNTSADMWALGVMLYELCTLERPFSAPNRYKLLPVILAGKYTPISESRCPTELIAIIKSLLSVDPKKRPTARALLQNPFIRNGAAKFDLLKFFPKGLPPSPVPAPKPDTPTPVPSGQASAVYSVSYQSSLPCLSPEYQKLETNKDNLVFMSKVLENAEDYDEMATCMRAAARLKTEFSSEERGLFSVAHKNVVGERRKAWRTFVAIKQKEEQKTPVDKFKIQMVQKSLDAVIKELTVINTGVVEIIDKNIIPYTTTAEGRVFFHKMKGDYLRFMTDYLVGSELKSVTERSGAAYKTSTDIAAKNLLPTNSIRLGLALNYSVFFYEVLEKPEQACATAKKAFDDAIAELDTLSEESYKDATLIMQLLRDNLSLWTSEKIGK